jgi:TonB family protein
MKATPFRFVVSLLVVGLASISSDAQSAGQTQQKASQEDEFLKGAFLPDTADLSYPVVVFQKTPLYAPGAMRAKIQGDVELQAVVLADGRVDRARVTASLDKTYGLDESAIAAVKQWRFKPGKLNDIPVPVVVTIQMSFKLYICDESGCTGGTVEPLCVWKVGNPLRTIKCGARSLKWAAERANKPRGESRLDAPTGRIINSGTRCHYLPTVGVQRRETHDVRAE